MPEDCVELFRYAVAVCKGTEFRAPRSVMVSMLLMYKDRLAAAGAVAKAEALNRLINRWWFDE